MNIPYLNTQTADGIKVRIAIESIAKVWEVTDDKTSCLLEFFGDDPVMEVKTPYDGFWSNVEVLRCDSMDLGLNDFKVGMTQ